MNRLILVALAAGVLCLAASACALKNPSAVYCTGMGYEFLVAETPQGENGVCKLPDGSYVSAWWFLEGKVKREFTYCGKNGYGIKTISGELCDRNVINDECSVCIMPDGREIEVSELMNLSFSELVCGDGICGMGPENWTSCPQDCNASSVDGFCNAAGPGCDPDCEDGEDSDCRDGSVPVEAPGAAGQGADLNIIIAVLAVLASIMCLAVFIRKRPKKAPDAGEAKKADKAV